jgi:DNA topoisomerase VI subunit A
MSKTTTRVRGFAPWRPNAETQALLETVQAILVEYEAYLLVDNFRLDRQRGQEPRLFFCVEAAGMVPLVEEIADPYGIKVISGGGFDSTTSKYLLAQTLAKLDSAEVLHIGDYDPSGVHVFSSIGEDVRAFVRRMAMDEDRFSFPEFTRLAVTPEQVEELNLPTAPPKETDRRSFEGNETTQVEAIPPDVLAEIVRSAIESRVDEEALEAVKAEEESTKAQLHQRLDTVLEDFGEDR